MKIIIIAKDDLVRYPPTLSLINVLLKLGKKVVCIGEYSDKERKKSLEQDGVKFIPIFLELKDKTKYRIINWCFLLWRKHKYSSKLKSLLHSQEVQKDDLIWFIYSNTAGYLQKAIERNPYVIQFYEFDNYFLDGKEKWFHPWYDARRFLSSAKALIHCEYNRAMITNGLFGLKTAPVILPNKPFEKDEQTGIIVPEEISHLVEEVKKNINGRKVILYQGIFNATERRLDEFCEAIELLPKDFVFIAMGGGGDYHDLIKKKYNSNRIYFIPFIRPPYHLLITKLAHYGILTYNPVNSSYVGVINPLYCAPNKIFEYGKFGIPMIANDVPGLKLIFEVYKCGKTISFPITPKRIAETILNMEKKYEELSKGARSYYESVDVEELVKEVLNMA